MSTEQRFSPDWIEDSALWHGGMVLVGDFAHWCPAWDDLPIDETCSEFGCCSCFEGDPAAEAARAWYRCASAAWAEQWEREHPGELPF